MSSCTDPSPDISHDPGSASAASTRCHIRLADEAATVAFATRIGPVLRAGDVLLLTGDLGAGKTFLARALIQGRLALSGRIEDVPSPSFTLVQTYDLDDVELWHVDLYRLSGADELHELGLDQAFETAICLIEWPDRLQDLRPDGAVELILSDQGETARTLQVNGLDTPLGQRLRACLTPPAMAADG